MRKSRDRLDVWLETAYNLPLWDQHLLGSYVHHVFNAEVHAVSSMFTVLGRPSERARRFLR